LPDQFEIVDLSQPFASDIPVFPTVAAPIVSTMVDYHPSSANPNLVGWYRSHLSFTPHVSTHVDAPIHVNRRGLSVDEIPLDRLINWGVVLDVPKIAREEITPEDVKNAEPEIGKGEIVILNTGWHRYWSSEKGREGTQEYSRDFPGLAPDCARWLRKKEVRCVMIDTPALDTPANLRSLPWPCHQELYESNIPGVENIGGDVDSVTGKRCLIICSPVKFVRGDAFPVRVVALVPHTER
jgi:kynurenine formamidase